MKNTWLMQKTAGKGGLKSKEWIRQIENIQ